MNRTNFILKFEFADATKKLLVARMKLTNPIYGSRFLKVNTYQPSPVNFVLTSPSVDESQFFSNNNHNKDRSIIAIGLSGLNNEFPMVPIDQKFSVLKEVEVFMFYPDKSDAISDYRKSWTRVDFSIFHDDEAQLPLKEMNSTVFFLRLDCVEGTNDTVAEVNFKLPKPIFREIQIINWTSGGGHDFIVTPIVEESLFIMNDSDIDMPVIAYGLNGISRDGKKVRVRENCSTQ